MFELRPYQKKFIDDIQKQFIRLSNEKKKIARKGRVCGVMPCGAGKTLATADMTKKSAAKGKRVVFMVHRKELIEQTSKTFTAMDIEHGIISPRGKVQPCAYLNMELGDVRETPFDQIWRSNKILARLRTLNYGGKCGACRYKNACGGCRARAACYHDGDFMAEDQCIMRIDESNR